MDSSPSELATTVENQSSKTTWYWRVMAQVSRLKTKGTDDAWFWVDPTWAWEFLFILHGLIEDVD
jgi:hypothetical protein